MMQREYQKHIDDFSELLVSEVTTAFDHIDFELYPVAPQHLVLISTFCEQILLVNIDANFLCFYSRMLWTRA
jgi:hypothetical protein